MAAEESLEEQHAKIVAELAVGKVRTMDLGNHRTAWNALKGLPPPHNENLARMGYSFLSIYNNYFIFMIFQAAQVYKRRIFTRQWCWWSTASDCE